MDLALYHPAFGYYSRASQRSGRAGDFVTSVDVGPVFGQLLAVQIAEMLELAGATQLVEAGAGNGRLAADVMGALQASHPSLYDRLELHLSEASASARAVQPDTLGVAAARLASSAPDLPPSFDGVLYANELLDAMPVHQVVMRETGLCEVYVDTAGGQLVTVEDTPSTPALAQYLQDAGVTLQPGWTVEISLRGVEWIRDAARRIGRGFLLLIDYGHEASELYSVTHAAGTLTTYSQHQATGSEQADSRRPAWVLRAGEQDLTAHVDFTSIRKAAEAEGFVTLGLLDQTYFLMGLAGFGIADPSNLSTPLKPGDMRPFRTLTLPGGLGSTMKVLILGKNVGTPPLLGCSFRVRLT